ncbi:MULTISPECIES: hypothetical protein [unclassified Flavobacterium]|uniref:hypothetical protein n=1 Tax=unclassified Flavobacterium TaxID=196869 RepID=UPI000A3D68A6|nr:MULTISPECIES: hypothetical protein [unclassified Flavobacterium]MEA9414001.1 hypothetical protein [Flavobacterium sp. PL02]OUL59919.1 hypothetical protein B8T70_23045 [Flavobacterium sp. AJR]
MRKQYNLRPSKDGLRAWDVHRLIELSKNFPVKRVLLSEISEVNETYWFQDPSQLPTCTAILEHIKLMEEASLDYPIILCANGRLMDGMHRVMKALQQGHTDIKVVQFKTTPEPDFIGIPADELPY